MPGTTYGDNLLPQDKAAHQKLLGSCQSDLDAAQGARRSRETKWKKEYRLYNSWIEDRPKGDWHSRVFMPETFNAIETILPRLVAQLPKFLVAPVGEEDVKPAQTMELMLGHAVENSGLYLQLFDCMKDSLIYGTGILKTYRGDRLAVKTIPEPITREVPRTERIQLFDPETNQPLEGPDGEEVFDEQEIVDEVPTGAYKMTPMVFPAYDGPMGEAVDPFDFWPAPESRDIQSARYCIHRTRQSWADIKDLIKREIYTWPEGLIEKGSELDPSGDPSLERQQDIGVSDASPDANRKDAEVFEFWYKDGTCVTVIDMRAVVRVQKNPFFHQQKPFIRFTNYRMPHEFWGRSEIHSIEGLQDLVNAVTNQRIDEVRLKLSPPFAANLSMIRDRRQLQIRPDGVIEITGDGVRAEEVLHKIDLGEVNSSAFNEVGQAQNMIQRTTAASDIQMGIDSPGDETATGTEIKREQGASRFGLKSRLFELGPLKELALHFGTILQQFTTTEKVLRILGPGGAEQWERIDPMSLQGALDYSIETSSIQQSETMKREQAMRVLELLGQFTQPMVDPLTGIPTVLIPPDGMREALKDTLEAFGKKDASKYFGQQDPQQMMQQQMGMLPPGQQGIPGTGNAVPSEGVPTEQFA